MSFAAHTPGPWHFVQGGTGDFPTWNVRIWPAPASLVQLPGIAPMDEMDANSRLIAAAPELLEALQEVTDRLAWLNSDDDGHIMALTDRARAVIAKAEGK